MSTCSRSEGRRYAAGDACGRRITSRIDALDRFCHLPDGVVRADAERLPPRRARRRASGSFCSWRKRLRQRVWIVGINEYPASCLFENLGKRPATRLHDGNAGRHRLEQKDSLRLGVRGRNRHHVEAFVRTQFFPPDPARPDTRTPSPSPASFISRVSSSRYDSCSGARYPATRSRASVPLLFARNR